MCGYRLSPCNATRLGQGKILQGSVMLHHPPHHSLGPRLDHFPRQRHHWADLAGAALEFLQLKQSKHPAWMKTIDHP